MQFVSGGEVAIFQEGADIEIGQPVQERISQSLHEAMVLIPVLTPSFFQDPTCRKILTRFLEREHQLGRNDLVLAVYYQHIADLDDPQTSADPLLRNIARRRMLDWQPLRRQEFSDPHVRQALERLARRIMALLGEDAISGATAPGIAGSDDASAGTAAPHPPDAPAAPAGSNQQIDNPASNRGLQGIFHGPVNIYQGSEQPATAPAAPEAAPTAEQSAPEAAPVKSSKGVITWIEAHPIMATLISTIVVGILTFLGALWGSHV